MRLRQLQQSIQIEPIRNNAGPGMNGINSSVAHEISAICELFIGKYDPMWENGVRN